MWISTSWLALIVVVYSLYVSVSLFVVCVSAVGWVGLRSLAQSTMSSIAMIMNAMEIRVSSVHLRRGVEFLIRRANL